MEKQFAAFQVNDVKYCINIMDIKKVVRERNLTKIPNFPSFVEGIINLNGKVIPILSIHKKMAYHGVFETNFSEERNENVDLNSQFDSDLNIASSQTHVHNHSFKILIVQIDNTLVGVLVDELDKIITVADSDMQNIYDIGERRENKMISGVLHVDEEIYYTIDVQGILEGEEKALIDSYLQETK